MIDLGKYHRPHGLDVDPRSGRLVVTAENPDGLLLVDSQWRKIVRFHELPGRTWVRLSAHGEWAHCSNAIALR